MKIKYIALLRGINVGGNNKIAMSELKKAFEENGFTDVSTYINSGNVIFTSDLKDIIELQTKCSELIKESFGLKIAVSVISAESLKKALENAPAWWDCDSLSKHNAIFVISPTTAKDLIEEVGQLKPEYEKADFHGQVIFWSAPVSTFSHTRWATVISTSAAKHVTIRNANTAKKLAQLMQG